MAVLTYVLNPDQDKVLLVHHLADEGDPSYGRLNGFDGPILPHEQPAQAARRAVREHSGLEPQILYFRGIVHWSGFGPDQRGTVGMVFLCPQFRGVLRNDQAARRLRWIPLDELMVNPQWPLWPGDQHIMPLVFDTDPRPFFGVMPYDSGAPAAWYAERLPVGARAPLFEDDIDFMPSA